MKETKTDLETLDQLIQSSNAAAGPFLRSSFGIPEHTLSSAQLIAKLGESVTLALGTVTSDGRPRVAPVIALFFRGAFYIPSVRNALRTRHVRNNPAVSLSLYEGNDFALIAHGDAEIITPDSSVFTELVDAQIEYAGSDVRTWGDPIFLHIRAARLFSFARYPDKFPSQAACG